MTSILFLFLCLRDALPLIDLLEREVPDKTGKLVKLLNFPIGALVQHMLLSPCGWNNLTQCKQSKTLTAEDAERSRLPAPHWTYIPRKLPNGLMYGPMNGQRSRRSVFQTLQQIRVTSGQTAYLGDIVLVPSSEDRDFVPSDDNGVPPQNWARLRGLYWGKCETSAEECVIALISDLMPAAAPTKKRARSPQQLNSPGEQKLDMLYCMKTCPIRFSCEVN